MPSMAQQRLQARLSTRAHAYAHVDECGCYCPAAAAAAAVHRGAGQPWRCGDEKRWGRGPCPSDGAPAVWCQ